MRGDSGYEVACITALTNRLSRAGHALPPKASPLAAVRTVALGPVITQQQQQPRTSRKGDTSQRLHTALQRQLGCPAAEAPPHSSPVSPRRRARTGTVGRSAALDGDAQSDGENDAPERRAAAAASTAAATTAASTAAAATVGKVAALQAALRSARGTNGPSTADRGRAATSDVESFVKEVDPETGLVRIVKLDAPTPQPHRAARAESARSALLVRSSQPFARSVLRRAAAAAATSTTSTTSASAAGPGPAAEAAAVACSSSSLLSPASPPHPNVTVRSPGGTMRRRPLQAAPPLLHSTSEGDSDAVPPQSSSLGPPLTDEELRDALITEAALGQRQQERLRLQRAAAGAALLGLAAWAAQAPGAEAAGFGAMGRLAAAAVASMGRLVRGSFGHSG